MNVMKGKELQLNSLSKVNPPNPIRDTGHVTDYMKHTLHQRQHSSFHVPVSIRVRSFLLSILLVKKHFVVRRPLRFVVFHSEHLQHESRSNVSLLRVKMFHSSHVCLPQDL